MAEINIRGRNYFGFLVVIGNLRAFTRTGKFDLIAANVTGTVSKYQVDTVVSITIRHTRESDPVGLQP